MSAVIPLTGCTCHTGAGLTVRALDGEERRLCPACYETWITASIGAARAARPARLAAEREAAVVVASAAREAATALGHEQTPEHAAAWDVVGVAERAVTTAGRAIRDNGKPCGCTSCDHDRWLRRPMAIPRHEAAATAPRPRQARRLALVDEPRCGCGAAGPVQYRAPGATEVERFCEACLVRQIESLGGTPRRYRDETAAYEARPMAIGRDIGRVLRRHRAW
jgi:hypothetical protein